MADDYRAIARHAAQKAGIDPDLFERQIHQESGFNPHAVSPAGARGISQFMPDTAAGLGINPDNPVEALHGAAKLMGSYVRQYGSYEAALRAYNAGPGNIAKSHGFAETNAYVSSILGGHKPSAPAPARPRAVRAARKAATPSTPSAPSIAGLTATPSTPQESRRAALQQYVLSEDTDPDAVLHLALGLSAAKDLPKAGAALTSAAPAGGTSRAARVAQVQAGGSVKRPGRVGKIKSEANLIDSAKVPYLWGGGHGGKQARGSKVTPLDCSGAVSRALGLNPRVASQFKQFGQPGTGKRVTIYAKDTHVLLEVDGHFWGTSHANPGGGAGWIPAGYINGSYLAGFTARHPNGM